MPAADTASPATPPEVENSSFSIPEDHGVRATVNWKSFTITYEKPDAASKVPPVYTITADRQEMMNGNIPWACVEAIKAGDALLLRALLKHDPSVLQAKGEFGAAYLLRTAAIVRDAHTACPVHFAGDGLIAALCDAVWIVTCPLKRRES